MNAILTTVAVLLAGQVAHGRLGETRDQSEARYGLPKSERTPKGMTPLLEGARELTFHHQGFRIRCALLLATDGQEYVVREEYVRQLGNVPIKDFEVHAILEAEKNGQSWTMKKLDAIALQDFQKPPAARVETRATSFGTRPEPAGILDEPKSVAKKPAGSQPAVAPKPVAPPRSPASPFILAASGPTWVRPDGATACYPNGGANVRLDLPQAARYEAEANAAKVQQERELVPNF